MDGIFPKGISTILLLYNHFTAYRSASILFAISNPAANYSSPNTNDIFWYQNY